MDTAFNAGAGILTACALALVLGGLVKGTIGMGLPLVATPVLALALTVPEAIAILSLPVLLTNVWQTAHGRHYGVILRRLWLVLIGLGLGAVAGVRLLVTIDPKKLSLILGVIVLIYPLTLLLRIDFRITPRSEAWAGPLVGLVAGTMAAISHFFGPPLAVYFAALQLHKDQFVTAMALLGLFVTALVTASLIHYRILTGAGAVLSFLASIPALAGIWLGIRIRSRINQKLFYRLIAVALLAMGLNLIWKAFT